MTTLVSPCKHPGQSAAKEGGGGALPVVSGPALQNLERPLKKQLSKKQAEAIVGILSGGGIFVER